MRGTQYRFRAYAAALGRFLQRDPLGLQPDPSVYEYCHSRPVTLTDALGLDPFGLAQAAKRAEKLVNCLSAVWKDCIKRRNRLCRRPAAAMRNWRKRHGGEDFALGATGSPDKDSADDHINALIAGATKLVGGGSATATSAGTSMAHASLTQYGLTNLLIPPTEEQRLKLEEHARWMLEALATSDRLCLEDVQKKCGSI